MKRTNLIFPALLLIFFACKNPNADKVSVDVTADTTHADAMKDTMADSDDGKFAEVDSATMMKAWMDYATPGDMHKWMAKFDGTWTGARIRQMEAAMLRMKTVSLIILPERLRSTGAVSQATPSAVLICTRVVKYRPWGSCTSS